MRGFFSPEETSELRDAFMAASPDGPVLGLSEIKASYGPDDPLARWPRMMHPHRHPELSIGPLAMRRMLDRRIESVLRALFGEEPVAFWIRRRLHVNVGVRAVSSRRGVGDAIALVAPGRAAVA